MGLLYLTFIDFLNIQIAKWEALGMAKGRKKPSKKKE